MPCAQDLHDNISKMLSLQLSACQNHAVLCTDSSLEMLADCPVDSLTANFDVAGQVQNLMRCWLVWAQVWPASL